MERIFQHFSGNRQKPKQQHNNQTRQHLSEMHVTVSYQQNIPLNEFRLGVLETGDV